MIRDRSKHCGKPYLYEKNSFNAGFYPNKTLLINLMKTKKDC